MSGKAGKSGPPGNGNSLVHGVYATPANASQLRDRRVRRLMAKARALLPGLEPSDAPTLRAWCELEVLCQLVFRSLTRRGEDGEPQLLSADGMPRELLDKYRQLRAAQLPYAKELGLTPSARKALGLSGKREVHLSDYLAARYKAQDVPTPKAEATHAPGGELAPAGECGGPEAHGAEEGEGA